MVLSPASFYLHLVGDDVRKLFRSKGGFMSLCVALAAVVAAAQAPYLMRLADEGYPAPRWPAAGAFVPVQGRPGPVPHALPQRLPNGWLEDLMQESEASALLVYQGGSLRMEAYRQGARADTKFNSYSLVKSLVGALVLKAVADQKLGPLNTPLGTYLPGVGSGAVSHVTLDALLDMRSGILFEPTALKKIGMKQVSGVAEKDLEKTLFNPFGPMAQMHFQGIEHVLPHLRVSKTSVDVFNYQNVNTALLGLVLERAYGRPLAEILALEVWQPSGAGPAHWRQYAPDGRVSAYCCLYARARDWVQVAHFLQANGRLQTNGTSGEPFLPHVLWQRLMGLGLSPAEREAGAYETHMRHDILNRPGEALQGRFSYFLGQGGQIVYLMPEADLTVVRFGQRHQKLHSTLYAVWRSVGG